MKKVLWHAIKLLTPAPLRAAVDEAALKLAYMPSVDESSARLPKPVVVISADFELAWAWRYAEGGLPLALQKAKIERAQTPRLLKLLDELSIPITWATVGLLADPKAGRGLAPPPSLPAYQAAYWKFPGGDPFRSPGGENLDLSGPDWYAPDLIEGILAASAGHEIGSHSFAHHDTSVANCPRDYFSWDLAASQEALARFGVRPTSFVFPGNQPGHLDLLRAHGMRCVRHYPWQPEVEVASPRRHEGALWGLHQSICLEAYGGDATYIGRKTRALLRKSLASQRVVSLWFHPSLDDHDLEASFRPTLKLCAELRDRGDIEVLTMTQLADRMDATEPRR
jgi:hypothetical protein